MKTLRDLFANNKQWAERMQREHPGFFESLWQQQAPHYLWIGCSDSRVPANEIVGLPPGELFVHRNVANMVVHTDINLLSVLQYAVEVLRVEHVIVCGHYDCGGVLAAMDSKAHGLIDNWLRHIRDVHDKHRATLEEISDPQQRAHRLVELNIIEQVHNVCSTTIVQQAWRNGQSLAVHGWVYSLRDGLLRDLDTCITGPGDLADAYRLH
jgi:carbonic anhydrase